MSVYTRIFMQMCTSLYVRAMQMNLKRGGGGGEKKLM